MNRLPTLVACAVAAPLVVVTVGMLAFAAAELSGRTPLAYDRPRNVAEAAGMANGSEVLRFLRAGEDPTSVMEVRPESIFSSVSRLTAFEAAVLSRRFRLVQMLDRERAITDVDERERLACFAAELNEQGISDYLAPDGATCDPAGVYEEILLRMP